jgi:hypothetical protein
LANLILSSLVTPFDDVRDLLAEALGDLFGGDVGVFDRVVQQAGGDGGRVHLQLGQHLRDLQRMDDVGLARGALLALMLLQAELPGPADEVEVVAGAVLVSAPGQRRRRTRRRDDRWDRNRRFIRVRTEFREYGHRSHEYQAPSQPPEPGCGPIDFVDNFSREVHGQSPGLMSRQIRGVRSGGPSLSLASN